MDIFDMTEIVKEISYKNWDFVLRRKSKTHPIYLQVQFKAPCSGKNNVAELKTQHGRKWRLSRHMTRSEVVKTALKAVLTAEEHEARETFTFRGEAIFGPHFDVDELVGLAGRSAVDVRDGRGETADGKRQKAEVRSEKRGASAISPDLAEAAEITNEYLTDNN